MQEQEKDQEKSIKIFVTYKEKHQIIETDIVKPIQTGRAIADEVFEGMIGDDTGDNISKENAKYSELTAQYWAWKNYDKIGNPDYIGFMHYRRHFLFGNKNYTPDYYGLVKFDEINETYIKSDLTDDENIRKIVGNNDAIIPNRIDLRKIAKNNFEHYKKYHNIEDLKEAYRILEQKYPEYTPIIQEYNNSYFAYFLNMFVFKKQIFFEYCEWLFSILFELRENLDFFNRDPYQKRVLGFIAERLTGIFFLKLYKDNYKIKTLPVSFIANTNFKMQGKIEKSAAVALVLSCSNEFVPYLSVCLQSIKENCNDFTNYEITILERNISIENKKRIEKQIAKDNITIKFLNMQQKIEKFKEFCIDKHFTIDTYSRFFIPEILPQYDKCIYLDADLIVRTDIKALFDIDFEGMSIAACRDTIMNCLYKKNRKFMKSYFEKILKMDSPEKYFQGGVMLMNCAKMRTMNTVKSLINLALKQKVLFVDQCISNIFFKKDIKYVDISWNYEYESSDTKIQNLIELLPLNILNEYLKAKANPKIIHYIGPKKPWTYLDEEYAEIWWDYARRTPYYEIILQRMLKVNSNLEPVRKLTAELKDAFKYRQNVLKYWRYKLMAKIMFGQKKEHYIKKKQIWKNKIRIGKQLRGEK